MRTQGQFKRAADLLDMGRFAGAVIAGDHDAPVAGEAGKDRERGVAVEDVVRIEVRHVLVPRREGRRFKIDVDAEHLADESSCPARPAPVSEMASMKASCGGPKRRPATVLKGGPRPMPASIPSGAA
jgi:hypothetical protein